MKFIIITIVLLVILVIVYILYKRIRDKFISKIIKQPRNAKMSYKVSNELIKPSIPNYGNSWTISSWIYIDDWNYKYGQDKYIINWKNCNIFLSKTENNLIIHVPVYNSKLGEKIMYKSLPLQKWINIVVVLDNRHLDLWINGRLYHSKHLNNVPLENTGGVFDILPKGGFSGYISRLNYYPLAIPRKSIMFKDNIIDNFKKGPFVSKNPILSKSNNLKNTTKEVTSDIDY